MTEITVAGLGLMGSALARAIHRAGHALTVWNRSPARMQPFAEQGVATSEDLASAVAASPVLLVCIDTLATTQGLLGTAEVAPLLEGRAVVQLSSGTPREAHDAAIWMQARGAAYLDGKILAGPADIGTADARILLAGDADAEARARGLLECLGDGTVTYLGPNIRAAAALDLAWLTARYGMFLSAIHSASLCRAEGVDLDALIGVLGSTPSLQRYLRVIRDDAYDDYTASLRVWGEALRHIRTQGTDAGINTEFPDFAASLFDRAIAAGLGESNVMSLVKVLEATPKD